MGDMVKVGTRARYLNSQSQPKADEMAAPFDDAKKSGLKLKWDQFLRTTSYHGFSEFLTAPNRVWKAFWVLVMIGCFIMISYQFQKIISQFVAHPVTTSVSRQYKHQMELPDITVCLPHRVNWTRAKTQNLSVELLEYMNAAFLARYPHHHQGDWGNSGKDKATLETQYRKFIDRNRYKSIAEFYENFALSCEKVFRSCMFNGVLLEGGCCRHVKTVTMDHGECFLIEPRVGNAEVEQSLGGPHGGLVFLIATNPEDRPPTYYNTFQDDGVFVFIGHPHLDDKPVPMDANSIVVSVGTHAYISLKAMHYVNIPGYGCHKEVSLAFFDGYGKQACLYECILNATMRYCGCVPLGYNVSHNLFDEARMCEPIDMMNCVNRYLYNYTGQNITRDKIADFTEQVHHCDDNCGNLCDYLEYEPRIMYTKYPTEQQDARFRQEFGFEKGEAHDHLILIELYFSDIAEIEIKQVKTATIDNLVANLGGYLGLFAGCSVVTLIHMVIHWFGYMFKRVMPDAYATALGFM